MWLIDFFKVLFGGWTKEVPSLSDIVPKENIYIIGNTVVVDYGKKLNIPFTRTPFILPIMDIPDSNSMDGLMDIGHNPVYIQPADRENQSILADWLASEWKSSKGKLANDCVYRVMVDSADNPYDFSKPHKNYAIHRISEVAYDDNGRFFKFKGINNSIEDPPKVRDAEILFVNTQLIF